MVEGELLDFIEIFGHIVKQALGKHAGGFATGGFARWKHVVIHGFLAVLDVSVMRGGVTIRKPARKSSAETRTACIPSLLTTSFRTGTPRRFLLARRCRTSAGVVSRVS